MVAGLAALGLWAVGVAQAEWKFSGYTQTRYNFWDSDLGKDDAFDLARARVKFEGPVSEDTTMKIQVDLSKLDDTGSGSVVLKDAVFTHTLNPQWTATIGLTENLPFGYEVGYSSSKRLPLERSYAEGQLFPGEADTGLYLHYLAPQGARPSVDFGVSNGMAKWYETDGAGNKDTGSRAYTARVQWKLPNNGVAGVSYRHAARTRSLGGTKSDFSDNLLGVHARYSFAKSLALQAELYDGANLGTDVRGWYGQAEYRFDTAPVAAFYRYDTYDFGGSADYTRHTLGVAWDRGKSTRLTLQGEGYDDGKGGSFTNIAVQVQTMY